MPEINSWDRIRFQANEDDFRSVLWPPLGPYWCSGSSAYHSIVVAYVPHGTTDEELKKYWPEAEEIDRMQEGIPIRFSDRFAQPSWWPIVADTKL